MEARESSKSAILAFHLSRFCDAATDIAYSASSTSEHEACTCYSGSRRSEAVEGRLQKRNVTPTRISLSITLRSHEVVHASRYFLILI